MSYASPPPIALTSSRLKDRVIFVTGASSGIGAAAVRLFAAEGAMVAAASRRVELLDSLAAEMTEKGFQVAALACDVRDEESVKAAIAKTLATYGRLDGAFNNAGVGSNAKPFHELPTEKFDQVVATNLRGVFLCMKHEIAAMLQSGGGAIVNTSSIAGLIGGLKNVEYSASKWGLTALVKCAALEYARAGIRVNAIAPGPTDTEMFRNWMPTPEARAAKAEQFPMNYIAHPDDMARAALFLLSDEARWTTGAILPCDGGRSIG